MHNRGPFSLDVSSKEDRRAKDALESRDQSPVLCPSLLHAKGLQHLRRTSELYHLGLLADCQCGQKDRDQPVLPPRKSVGWVAGHLERELTIAPFVEQLSCGRLLNRQSAEHEEPRRKPEILVRLLTLKTDAGYGLRAPKFLLGDDQVARKTTNNRPSGLKVVVLMCPRSGGHPIVVYCSKTHLA
jgi:hypothetical protein